MDNWQRVSKFAIVDFFIKNLIKLASVSIYAIPAVWASSDTLKENIPYVIMGVSTAICLLAISAFLEYYFFKYRLKEDNIEIHAGVFFKKHLDLPFTRIQNVKLITPVYFRPFDYTIMELDTAGSVKNEAKIVAVPVSKANEMKQHILTYQAGHQVNNDDAQPIEETNETTDSNGEKLLNERSLQDLVIHGLTNNRIFIFLAMMAPIADSIFENTHDFLLSFGLDVKSVLFESNQPIWQLSLYFIASFIMAYIIVMLLSILGSIIAFYGYKLTKQDNNYIQRSGLLSIHEVVMKKPRLQMIVRQQDWLDVIIKRINLKFEQMGGIERNQQNSLRNKLMVPSIKEDECSALVDDVWPTNQLTSIAYQPISQRFIVRSVGLFITPITVIMCVLSVINQQWILVLPALVFFVVASGLVWCRWRRWGYAIDDEFIYVRKGLLGVNYYCFTIEKTQMIKFKQSIFLRRHKLCHINFVTAASALTIPFIPKDIGWHLLSQSLHKVESLKKNWM
jgi:putative membrane protein